MLERLLDGPTTVSQLGADHDMTPGAISQHLRVLERATLIRRRLNGRQHHIELDESGLQPVLTWADKWYAVSVRQAFSAWADPSKIEKWFGPKGFRAEVLEMDLRIGGHWRFKMVSQSGEVSHHHGRYLEIEADKLLSFTWESEEDTDLTEGRVTLVHERLPTQQAKQALEFGWSSGMPKLGRLLEAKRDD